MSTKIKISHPDLEDGADVVIDRLGVFENGAEYDLADEEVEAYEAAVGVPLDESDKFLAVASVVTAPAKKTTKKTEGSDN